MPKGTLLSRRALVRGACAALAAAGAGVLCGCNGPDLADRLSGKDAGTEPASGSTFAFDTYCTFTVYGDDAALARLSAACTRYDELFNLYDEASDIARINAAGGARVDVDPATAELIARALEYCEQADGLFDITIGAVSTLWDFEEGVRPADDAIAAALPHVDWRGVHVDTDASTVWLDDPEAKLDLGGIAKGYVADRLVELLRDETGATAAMISLGGNIALFGTKPDGSTWDIGVRDPNDPGGSTVVGRAHLAEPLSLVTSGLYERTFELDGVTYWHILDPRTGMPVATDVDAVTVACPSSTMADALSTTLFVAGSAQGASIADEHDQTGALFLKQDGTSAGSARWQELTAFESGA
ncbi:FAD:protein FMN transferase [Collinsella tanakaei]|uniref:FAD:protein FMN transferase n=1 Tax=Collinsella tanakaei TaxID=626935 RepID=UPI0025A442C6|nr:FAD:protein FMN transferase [Collinsella tanakaei]MDM8246302.1 FAD:protein FMN transferase [Collinsella tanakaei]